ncbi:MAG: alpha/beta hydrolase [Marinovum algicola]|uniref:Palmitoyl-protein thioesterase ABHD10, mitochondrial n=1 Tax=Marinovum algicola TaxID=42444 RepID=A0A975W802_9RHOB|nr:MULTISPECIES: alpha/beta hydrolase [Marinovum]MDD9746109.1 alpha/beta hydrolase [Marinovum sp. PR37]SEI95306.1 Pimeloyl-ACP methyl ester carboxylesterase [Marinovum algicola]SLN10551.1 Alpha/beta hydrolase family protein [Marinovum algicola]
MTAPETLTTTQGRQIAYHKTEGDGPCVVFLGGFKSDMAGTKAVWLEDWCRDRGRAYLRFDYSGHGVSSGRFDEGCIGDWAEDTEAVIRATCEGPLVLVGSSMGGWISLLMSQRLDTVAGLVTIAAAPDFTEDGYWASFTEAQRAQVMEQGYYDAPSDYGAPYRITRRLIEDGRNHLVLRTPLALPFPVRCVQGTEDKAVSRATALRLLDHADSPDMALTLLKGADHSFSAPDCLPLIARAIEEVS